MAKLFNSVNVDLQGMLLLEQEGKDNLIDFAKLSNFHVQVVAVTCTMVLNWTVYLLRPAVKRTLVSPALQAESMVLLLLAL